MAGDAETGVAIMQLDAGLDSGPIFATETVPVGPGTTAGSLHDDLAARGARLLLDVLGDLAAGRAQAKPQSDIGVTYAAKIGPEDQHIDWTKGATEIERQIRALSPTPGAWFDLTGARVKLWAADVVDRTGKPGEAIDDRLTIACGAGALRLVTLQREGKKAMAAADFLRGTPIARGTVLS